MYLWKIRCTEKMKFYIKNIHLKKLFDVLYHFSLRKHSAKAVSSGFFHWNQVVVYFMWTSANSEVSGKIF